MNLRLRGRFSRRELLGAARVATIATLLVAVSYAGVVALLDFAVAQHLTGQVDRQLSARLQAAAASPGRAFSSEGIQTNGARYGLGIYGEPIRLWSFDETGTLVRSAPGDPLLPAGTRPPPSRVVTSLDDGVAGTTYRLQWQPVRAGWLLAGESLTELGHVEAVLIGSEAIAFPFLLLAFFLVALAIGLRSARPVEIARRRQLEFTADASHELRTPLSVIEAEVSLARTQPRSPEVYEAVLDRIGRESKRLRRIVEDLLWLARADSEPADPRGHRVDLCEVARVTAERFTAVAAARRQEIDVELPTFLNGGLPVSAPPEWVDKLAGTLADNACRYAGEGGRIKISAVRLDTNWLALRVEDDGPGVDPELGEELVHRFKRATTVEGGHGLGLAIADSVVRATGGRFQIGRSPLGGALFEASWRRSPER